MADKKTVRDEAPPPHDEGQFVAVCCDVIDLGLNLETFQGKAEIKDKTALVFLTVSEDGATVRQIAQEFSTSMGKKSNMRKFLEAWRGKPYTEDEVRKQGIPLDLLEGVGCMLNVAHKTSAKGHLYAFINSVSPLPKVLKDTTPSLKDYKRNDFWEKKKAEYAASVTAAGGKVPTGVSTQEGDMPEPTDDNLPF